MPAGARINRSKENKERTSKGGWIGTKISNQPGTPSHRAWTFLNTGVDPGPGPKKRKGGKK